jgi:SM-20-related protein
MICSTVCFCLAMLPSFFESKFDIHPGPNLGGQVTASRRGGPPCIGRRKLDFAKNAVQKFRRSGADADRRELLESSLAFGQNWQGISHLGGASFREILVVCLMYSRSQTPRMEIQFKRGSQFVIARDFLGPGELEGLLRYVLQHERKFKSSSIEQYGVSSTIRRSRVLSDLGKQRDLITRRLLHYLPSVLELLKIRPFHVSQIETQVTASNDGDYFKGHNDASPSGERVITFVHYFYREPKSFSGGRLRLYRTRTKGKEGIVAFLSRFNTVTPQQNHILFFPSYLLHEVLPVKCPSGAFADSRFTLNGWFCK